MKCLLVLALATAASAQLGGFQGIFENIRDQLHQQTHHPDDVDSIHGWRAEYHPTGTDHILLFINDQPNHRYCYVIKTASMWESLLTTDENIFKITEEIYALIEDPNHKERPLHPGDLATEYHHFDAAKECRGHDTCSDRYTPSFAGTAVPVPTSTPPASTNSQ